jgi:hypothetical protein
MSSAYAVALGGSLRRAEGRVKLGYARVWISMGWRVVRLCCSVLCGVAPGRECGEMPQIAASCLVLSAWGESGRRVLGSIVSVRICL